jgi:hypothetical protein
MVNVGVNIFSTGESPGVEDPLSVSSSASSRSETWEASNKRCLKAGGMSAVDRSLGVTGVNDVELVATVRTSERSGEVDRKPKA